VLPDGTSGMADAAWGDTAIELPDDAPTALVDVLTGRRVTAAGDGRRLEAAALLDILPVAVLVPDPRAAPA
jgi:hypothetical protein